MQALLDQWKTLGGTVGIIEAGAAGILYTKLLVPVTSRFN